jgi:large subunit ribosomal protein L13
MRTYSPRPNEVESAWWVVDAQDVVLGRLATQVAHVLRGKHKPTFAPHVDVGDHVVIVNAGGVKLTGAKAVQSLRHRHSGYPGGLRSISFGRLLEESPEKLVEQAVRGMLPRNTVSRAQIRKLKVYGGAEHPHAAQQPQPLPEQFARELKTV